jgi:hypothetical protein
MTDFNLRALIRDVCDNSTIADPQMLAKEVNRRIKRGERDAALEQALPVLVQHTISLSRSRTSPGHSGTDTQTSGAGGFNPSRKVARIRETWKRMLRDRINIGPELGDWKFLADCTAIDLSYAAAIREDHAKRNVTRAAQYRNLAELLTKHGVRTVAELPETVLAPTLGDAA